MTQSTQPLPVADTWFQIDPADEFGVRRVREPQASGGSIWFIEGRDACLLVDTSIGVGPIRAFLETVTDKPIIAFASVGYYDHAGGLHQFDARLIHEGDADRVQHPTRESSVIAFYFENALRALPQPGFDAATYEMTPCEPTRLLANGDTIDLGDRVFEVLHLPGVTKGTSGLFERASGVLFTGEAMVWNEGQVYSGEPADRSDDADLSAFCTSIKRLHDLPSVAVYPGHHARQSPEAMKEVISSFLRRTQDEGIV